MKRTVTTILALTLASALMAAPGRPPAGAGPGGGPGGPGGEKQRGGGEMLPPGALAEFLGLTDTQQEQAKVIREEMRAAIEPLRDQARATHEQVDAALDAGNAQQAGELMLSARALRDQIEAARDAADARFAALLTSEQTEKWEVYKQIVQLRRHGRGARQ